MKEELTPEIAEYLSTVLDEIVDKPALEGRTLGGWRIGALIGEGGTSDVYRAIREDDGAEGSLKILRETSGTAVRRFASEIGLLAASATKSLPRLIATGELDGRPYVITELLEPVDLPEKEKEIVRYILQVCGCVRVLHRAGIVHRDIKPQNVMRRKNGEIVLIDLGLAKDVGDSFLARDGMSVVDGKAVAAGTPGYAAPEQFSGGEITRQTDIHGLGMLLYTCLTRSRSLWTPGDDPVPRRWQEIVHRATCTVPKERYAEVSDFIAAIRNRGHRRGRRAAGLTVAALTVLTLIASQIDWTAQCERYRWNSICESFVTNIVSRELVWERLSTQNVGRVSIVNPVRAYRTVTNAVPGVRFPLNGGEHRFDRPVNLEAGVRYFVEGPGKLEAAFIVPASADAENGKTELHLARCICRSLSAEPIGKSGIAYYLDGGAALYFPEIERPSPADRQSVCIEDSKDNLLGFGHRIPAD